MSSLDLLSGCAIANLSAPDWESVLTRMSEVVIANGHAEPTFTEAILARERTYPTGLPTPVPTAIPHADPEHVIHPGVAVAQLAEPVEFGEMGGSGEVLPVRLVVMLCMTDGKAQVGALQAVLALLGNQESVEQLSAAAAEPGFDERVAAWLAG